MTFTLSHTNFNVFDLEKSVRFYKEALNLEEVRRKEPEDKSFVLAFLSDGDRRYQLELTWLADRSEPYDLGDNEIHLAFEVDDMEAAREKHAQMGCICYENASMGIYFIEDPDGYWLEIIPAKS